MTDYEHAVAMQTKPRLIKEIERLRSRIFDYQLACSQKQEIINGQEEEIERLREALEKIIEMTEFAENMNESGMIHQAGEIARAALEVK